jgi:hypothetical protein
MFQLVDLLHVLVLDSEVLELAFDLPDAVLHLVGLLYVDHKLIELLLQRIDLLVDAGRDLVLLGLVEDELFDLVVKALNHLEDALGVLLDVAHLLQDPLDLILLRFQARNDLVYALQVLIAVEILGSFLELTLHVSESLFFVFDFGKGVLDFFFQALDLLLLEVVLDTLVLNFLFLLKNLFVDRFLVLFPLTPELLQLLLDLSDLILQHSKILPLQLL